MMATKKNRQNDERDPSVKRLDCIIRLFSEVLKCTDPKNFNEGSTARLLNSSGLTPTEIAKVLGKKTATDIAPHLYRKLKK